MVLLTPDIGRIPSFDDTVLTFQYGAINPPSTIDIFTFIFLLTFQYGAINPSVEYLIYKYSLILTFQYGAINPR